MYGDDDPGLTYHVTVGSLASGDAFAGALSRTAGEDVIAPGPTYPIGQGTLTAGSNYALTFFGANLTITAAPLTVTAAAASKVYGDPVPSLTGNISGTKFTDAFTANYSAYLGGGGMVLVDATTAIGGYPIVPTLVAHPKLGNYSVSPSTAR